MQAERKKMSQELVDKTRDLEPGERVLLARHPNRPHIEDFVENVFTDFFEQKGDHLYDEDRSLATSGCPVRKGIERQRD